jgi:hypothetical protein
MWTVLRGNSFRENALARENASMKENVYKLGDKITRRHTTSSGILLSPAATTEDSSDRAPWEISEYVDDRSEDDYEPGSSRRRRPGREDSRQTSQQYSHTSERISIPGLTMRRSNALNHLPKSNIGNREDHLEQGVHEYGVRHPMERATKQTSFQDIYDPFQKFDDYHVTGPEPGFHEVAVPISNNVCILGSPWRYSYFNSDESQKGYAQTDTCRGRYESQENIGPSPTADHLRSSTAAHRRYVIVC